MALTDRGRPRFAQRLSRLAKRLRLELGASILLTDIWAFACVLFEMPSGRKPFAGGTMTDTLAAAVARQCVIRRANTSQRR